MADGKKITNKYYGGAKERYLREKVDTFVLRVPKGQKEVIQKRAAKLNMSLNSYIVSLIANDISDFVSQTAKTPSAPETEKNEKQEKQEKQKKNNLPSYLM